MKRKQTEEKIVFIANPKNGTWVRIEFESIQIGDIVRIRNVSTDICFIAKSRPYFDEGLQQWVVDWETEEEEKKTRISTYRLIN